MNNFIKNSNDPMRAIMTLKPYLKDIDVAASENDMLLFAITVRDLKGLISDLSKRKNNNDDCC